MSPGLGNRNRISRERVCLSGAHRCRVRRDHPCRRGLCDRHALRTYPIAHGDAQRLAHSMAVGVRGRVHIGVGVVEPIPDHPNRSRPTPMIYAVCNEPGCSLLIETDNPNGGGGKCHAHARKSTRAMRKTTARIKARAKGRCERCRQPVPYLVRHHVKPGDEDEAMSLALCAPCHHAIDPTATKTPPRVGYEGV
jgi:hypothetical protein